MSLTCTAAACLHCDDRDPGDLELVHCHFCPIISVKVRHMTESRHLVEVTTKLHGKGINRKGKELGPVWNLPQ